MNAKLWYQTVVVALICFGLLYYLFRCWRSKSVTLFGRGGFLKLTYDSNPLGYWAGMGVYISVFLAFLWILFDHLHDALAH
jgi:hypothetical protein